MEYRAWIGKPWPELNEGVLYSDAVKFSPSSPVPSLLEYYSSRYKESASQKGWLQRIKNGQIRVDGNVTTDADYPLRGGATLVYCRLPWREPDVPHLLGVLYEDDHLLAVNKPSGLQVLPGGLFQQRTVLKQLEWHTAEKEKPLQVCSASMATSNEARLWKPAPVHRLGRGTSGVLLCAKSPAAKSKLAADLAAGTSVSIGRIRKGDSEVDRRISKTYRALASGIIMEDEVVADIPIGKVKYEGVAGGLYMASEKDGKPSRSKVTVLWRNVVDNQTLVEVQIFTGRPHQIRIHLAALGHPLVGDPLYVSGGRPRDDLNNTVSANLEEKRLDPAEDGEAVVIPPHSVTAKIYPLHLFQTANVRHSGYILAVIDGRRYYNCVPYVWLPKAGICTARRLWLSVACLASFFCSPIYKPGADCCGTRTTRASDSR